MSTTIRRLAMAGLVALGVGTLCVAPASALLKRVAPLEELKLPSVPLGPPDGIAIDQETGNVYVGNRVADEIEIFGSHGGTPADGIPAQITGLVYHINPIELQSVASSGRQEARYQHGVAFDNACYYHHLSGSACEAFDPSNGDVYADEIGAVGKFKLNTVTHEYELVYEFKTPFDSGIAVDGDGDVYLVGSGSTVDELEWRGSSQPKEVRQIPGATSYALNAYVAVAPSGEVLYTGETEARNAFMLQLNAKGEVLSSTQLSAVSNSELAGGIAVDSNGTAYADNAVNVQEYNSVGSLVEEFGSGLTTKGEYGETFFSQGVAVNDESGDVYVVSRAGSVKVYGPPVLLPDVTTGNSSPTGPVSAVVSGSIDPDGLPATSRFEYGLSSEYGLLAGAVQAAGGPEPGSGQDGTGGAGCVPPGGAGCTPVPITATLTDLEPNATYHYRLDGVNANGINEGADGTFATPPAAPALENESASAVTTTTAILNATVNPNNEATSYHFEYGQTAAYGTTAPASGSAGEGYGRVHVGQPVAGLQPGATYHYRVITENATGRTAGPDQTFTTAGAPPPLASTGAPASVGSSSALVTGTVDPRGVGTAYRFQVGTDTSYGVEVFGSAGAGSEVVPVSLELESLQPDTTYHYRLVASSEGGVSYGADQTFTTGTVPGELLSAPTTLPLVATPVVTFPAYETGIATGKSGGAHKKTKHKKSRKKKVRKAKKGKVKKAGRAGSGRAAGHRDGRGRGA